MKRIALLAALTFAGAANNAMGHAVLLGSNPAADQVLDNRRTRFNCQFNENVGPFFSRCSMLRARRWEPPVRFASPETTCFALGRHFAEWDLRHHLSRPFPPTPTRWAGRFCLQLANRWRTWGRSVTRAVRLAVGGFRWRSTAGCCTQQELWRRNGLAPELDPTPGLRCERCPPTGPGGGSISQYCPRAGAGSGWCRNGCGGRRCVI